MSVELQAAELLEQGVEVLETKGWCRFTIHNEATDQHCALGALLQAEVNQGLRSTCEWSNPYDYSVDVGPSLTTAIKTLARVATGEENSSYREAASHDVARWNNALSRTAEEVIDAMKLAAKDLRNRAEPE